MASAAAPAEAARLSLSWADNSNNESGFRVERSIDGKTYSEVATTPTNTNYYVDSNVVAGKTYHYRVRAYNQYGLSSYSNTSVATVTASEPAPSSPTSGAVNSSIIGTMSKQGEYTYDSSANLHLVSASGSGYEAYNDELRYVYAPVSGDLRFRVRLHDFKPDGNWGRAGIMIRQSLKANSRQASVTVNGTGTYDAMYRSADGAIEDNLRGPQFEATKYMQLEKKADTVVLSYSHDGSSWSTLRTVKLPLSGTFYVGLSVGSQSDGNLTGGVFEVLQAPSGTFPTSSVSAPSSPTPSNFSPESSIIGTMTKQGSYSYDSTTNRHFASASGYGYEPYNDELRFAHIPASGDVRFRVRLHDFKPDGNWARAGIMIRQSLKPNSRQASMVINALGYYDAMYRPTDGAIEDNVRGPQFKTAKYLQIEKKADTVILSCSHDGSAWTTIRTVKLQLSGTYLIGLSVGSQSDPNLSSATFEVLEAPSSSTTSPDSETTTPSGFAPQSSIIGTMTNKGEYTRDVETGLHLVAASGYGYEPYNDELRYAYVSASGDFRMRARVRYFSPDGNWGRAGLMVRQSLKSNSKQASVAINGIGTYDAMYRATDGALEDNVRGPQYKSSQYLQLEKKADTIVFSYSHDGTTWTAFRTVKLQLSGTFLVGMSVGSQADPNLSSAIFEMLETP